MWYVQGRVYSLIENLESAKLCFVNALALDPLCHEAFEALGAGNMMNEAEYTKLISSIEKRVPFEWLPKLYRMKVTRKAEEVGGPLGGCREALAAKAHQLYANYSAVNDAYAITSKLVEQSPNALDRGFLVHLSCL